MENESRGIHNQNHVGEPVGSAPVSCSSERQHAQCCAGRAAQIVRDTARAAGRATGNHADMPGV